MPRRRSTRPTRTSEQSRPDPPRSPAVRVDRGRALEPPHSGAVAVTASVGPDGELIALWSDVSGREALLSSTSQPGWAQFPDATSRTSVNAVVTIQSTAIDQLTTLREFNIAHPHLQPLPGGETLVVGARCYFRSDRGADQNAFRFDSRGSLVASGTFGDGIGHVLATPLGNAYVGYFDEGVFGNYGWGAPDGPEPVGASGLNLFGSDFDLVRPYVPDEGFDTMADCYALNADGEDAWISYYTDFPVVHVAEDGTRSSWTSSVGGVRALIADANDIALIGGYQGERDRVVLGRLVDGELEITATRRLVLPDGADLSASARFVCRGRRLYVGVDLCWYELSLDDVLEAG
jgi:hypothetical protein